MSLSRRSGGYLLGVSAFTVFTWVVFIRNIARDHAPGHGTAFHVVHYVLAAVSIALAVGVARIGWRGLRGAGAPGTRRTGAAGGAGTPAGTPAGAASPPVASGPVASGPGA